MGRALYVHIPFCDAICSYCDFARVLNKPKLVDEYLDVLYEDIQQQQLANIETIYIGGGTPSALNLNQLTKLFEMLKPYTNNISEYTIEINPESLTKDKADLMVQYGLNRASLGMQVTQDNLLKIINRRHTNSEVDEAINTLQNAGIHNISVDLMYGIPTQTISDLKESLDVIMTFNITHVSLYALTIEPNSAFGRLGYREAPQDLDADMYELAVDYLKSNGFNRYEISNFSKDEKESEHNKVYWRYDDFVAVGLHASGKENHVRYTNTRNLRDYLNGHKNQEIIKLSKDDEMFEYIMMNLRMSCGFNINDFNARFEADFISKYASVLDELQKSQLIVIEDNTIRATNSGLELLFDVLEKFME